MNLLYASVALLVAAAVVWIYARREPPAAGRTLPALLRVLSLLLVAVLLLDLRLPATGPGDGPARWVLLDASASMGVGGAWEAAVERARVLGEEGARIVVFGQGTEAVDPDSLARRGPEERDSRLAPALARAAEGGATEVVVLSDLRVRDPVEAAAVVAELPAVPAWEGVGAGPVRNAALGEWSLPSGARGGEPLRAVVVVEGEAPEGDSARVEVLEEGRVVAQRTVTLPGPGRSRRIELELPAPRARGEVRYSARVTLSGDAFAEDDRRVAYVTVDPREGGAVLVSLDPDWEPRFLLPVMRQATGMRVEGWIAVAGGLFLPLGDGERVEEGGLLRRLRSADLVVLHGAGRRTAPAILEAAGRAPRLLLWPRDARGAAVAGIAVGSPLAGEWYVPDEIPASPLAPELAGVGVASLPPLSPVLPLLREEAGATVALRARLRGSGPGEAVVALREEEGRRIAVVLAGDFWRWAFREGEPREAYRRLWSATLGWLLAGEAASGERAFRPVRRVTSAGEPIEWLGPPGVGASLSVAAVPEGEGGRPGGEGGAGEVVFDTLLSLEEAGRAVTGPMPPGPYRYEATDEASGTALGSGRFDVEAFSDELLLPPMDTAGLPPPAGTRDAGEGPGRPLRTHPLPYLLLLALLAAEWILRRRRGLR